MQTPLITPELKKATSLLLGVTAREQEIRPIVAGYQTEILERHQWPTAKEWRTAGEEIETILDPKHSYLISDADFAIFMDECEEAKAATGWSHFQRGHCPLSTVEYARMNAERSMLKAAMYITEIDPDEFWDMEARRTLIELVIGIVLGTDAPSKKEIIADVTVAYPELIAAPPKTAEEVALSGQASNAYDELVASHGMIDDGTLAKMIRFSRGNVLQHLADALNTALASATAA